MYKLPQLEVDDHELELITRSLIGTAYLLNKSGNKEQAALHLVVAAKAGKSKLNYQEAMLPLLVNAHNLDPLNVVQEH